MNSRPSPASPSHFLQPGYAGSERRRSLIWIGARPKFLSKQAFVGLVGYAYQQITDDKGGHPILGGFRSRRSRHWPAVRLYFPDRRHAGIPEPKRIRRFDAANRPSGWNTWLTFAISTAPPSTVAPTRHGDEVTVYPTCRVVRQRRCLPATTMLFVRWNSSS